MRSAEVSSWGGGRASHGPRRGDATHQLVRGDDPRAVRLVWSRRCCGVRGVPTTSRSLAAKLPAQTGRIRAHAGECDEGGGQGGRNGLVEVSVHGAAVGFSGWWRGLLQGGGRVEPGAAGMIAVFLGMQLTDWLYFSAQVGRVLREALFLRSAQRLGRQQVGAAAVGTEGF